MKAFTKISAKDRHRKENFQGYLFITPLFLLNIKKGDVILKILYPKIGHKK